MNHKFYNKTKKEQNHILLAIAVCAFLLVALSVIIALYTEIYLIAILTFAITISLIAPFFDTPSLKKSGKLIYYSPLFITEKPRNGLIKIHGGTLFDYYFVIDKRMNGKQRTNFIIQLYLDGLLLLIDKHQKDKKLKIRGTSYIINSRTAEKIGFEIVETDMLQKIILIYNYFNIVVSYSMAKNKLSLPKLSNTKTFEADVQQLLERKAYIEQLNKSLKKTLPVSGDNN